MSVNKVILVGNLGADPELRRTPSGTAVCTMSVATNRRYTDKSQQVQEQVEWHRVTAWDKLAELCKSYLTKGRRVYVEGRIKHSSYNDKAGQKRYSTEIVSDTVVFLDGRGRAGDAGEGNRASEPGVDELDAGDREQMGPRKARGEDEIPF
jgi:single-strand DNA-binding protein